MRTTNPSLLQGEECSIIEEPSEELWRSFLEKFQEGNLEQSFEYGEISKKAFPKTRVVRLTATLHEEPVGVAQGIYSSYLGVGMTLGVIDGPLVYGGEEVRHRVFQELLEAVEQFGKENRVVEIQVQVPLSWQINPVLVDCDYSLKGMLNAYIVHLEGGREVLWRRIAHNKRRNIRKAVKEGVEVFQSHSHDDLLKFYSMLTASQDRGHFRSYPLSWLEATLNVCKPEQSRVFLTRWNDEAVSGVFTVTHGDTVYALSAGSYSRGWKVRPNDIMHWKIMEWACQEGYSRYQMGLLSHPPPREGSTSWGVWRWKREWRGSLEPISIFKKTISPKYRLILEAKKIIERGYKLFS